MSRRRTARAARAACRGTPSRRGRRPRGPAPRARAATSRALVGRRDARGRSTAAQPVWVVTAWSRQRAQVRAATSSASAVVARPRPRRRRGGERRVGQRGGRCARRTRWRAARSRPWPPRDGPAGASGSSQSPNCCDGDQEPVGAPARGERIDPRAHARPLVLEDARVAVRLVHRPRHDRRRVGPAGPPDPERPRRAPRRAPRSGRRAPRPAPSARSRSQLRQNASRVEQRRARRRERLRVAGPAQPLVALRAVRRHRDEVVALRPDDVLVEPVQAARREHSKVARGGGVAADRDELGVEELGVGLDLGVAEPVERERGLEHRRRRRQRGRRCRSPWRSGAPAGGATRRARAPRRAGPGPPMPARPAHPQPDEARDVLPAVELRHARAARRPPRRAGPRRPGRAARSGARSRGGSTSRTRAPVPSRRRRTRARPSPGWRSRRSMTAPS